MACLWLVCATNSLTSWLSAFAELVLAPSLALNITQFVLTTHSKTNTIVLHPENKNPFNMIVTYPESIIWYWESLDAHSSMRTLHVAGRFLEMSNLISESPGPFQSAQADVHLGPLGRESFRPHTPPSQQKQQKNNNYSLMGALCNLGKTLRIVYNNMKWMRGLSGVYSWQWNNCRCLCWVICVCVWLIFLNTWVFGQGKMWTSYGHDWLTQHNYVYV